jgi:hypothetical protein
MKISVNFMLVSMSRLGWKGGKCIVHFIGAERGTFRSRTGQHRHLGLGHLDPSRIGAQKPKYLKTPIPSTLVTFFHLPPLTSKEQDQHPWRKVGIDKS